MAGDIKYSDLKYKYSKKATNGDNPEFTGKPDSILFNRKEEYEVIPMLRAVFGEKGSYSKENLNKLEDLIQKKLPGKIRKREDVFDWLIANF